LTKIKITAMKKLSLWAKHNPRSARLFIIAGRIMLAAAGLFAGLLLASFSQFPVMPLACLAATLYGLAFIFYPRQKLQAISSEQASYTRRKTCDALLVYSSFLACLTFGNWLAQPLRTSTAAHSIPVAAASLERQSVWLMSRNRHESFRKVRKELRHVVREIRAVRKNIDPATMAGLTIFSVLLVIGAGILIAAFSCQLACNGQESAAILVILLGAVGVGLILFLLWHTALRNARRKAATESDK